MLVKVAPVVFLILTTDTSRTSYGVYCVSQNYDLYFASVIVM